MIVKNKIPTVFFVVAFQLSQNFVAAAMEPLGDSLTTDRIRIAQSIQVRLGIPASIQLAQFLLESGGGASMLARLTHNDFGIKCQHVALYENRKNGSKKVIGYFCQREGQCIEYTDDHKVCRFRVYDSEYASWEDHGKKLREKQYSKAFHLKISDYRGWAQVLQDAGYASNPHYAERLIKLIQQYRLDRYDEVPPVVKKKKCKAVQKTAFTFTRKINSDSLNLSTSGRCLCAAHDLQSSLVWNENTHITVFACIQKKYMYSNDYLRRKSVVCGN